LLEGLKQPVERFGCDVLNCVLLPNNPRLSLRAPQPTTEWAINSLFDLLARQERANVWFRTIVLHPVGYAQNRCQFVFLTPS